MVEDFWTVGEFIEALKEFPQDAPMALSTDAEGNEIRMVNGVEIGYVTSLEHRFMESIHETELENHDKWVLTVEVW